MQFDNLFNSLLPVEPNTLTLIFKLATIVFGYLQHYIYNIVLIGMC